jgi:hypothetical protein
MSDAGMAATHAVGDRGNHAGGAHRTTLSSTTPRPCVRSPTTTGRPRVRHKPRLGLGAVLGYAANSRAGRAWSWSAHTSPTIANRAATRWAFEEAEAIIQERIGDLREREITEFYCEAGILWLGIQ